jgi:hypothetical protein
MVRVLGDITGLGKSFTDASNTGSAAASKLHGAFSSVLNTLNSTGVLGPFGSTLQTANSTLEQMSGHAKDVSTKMMGIGGAAIGLGTALAAMGSKDQAAHQQLAAAIQVTGHSYDEYATKIEGAIKSQAKFGNSSSETQDALRKLTTATGDPKKALDLLNTATNLAAARHEDLSTAATQLGKVYNGNTKLLKEFGITVTTTTNPQKALTAATTAHQKALTSAATAQRTLLELQTADAASKTHTALQAMKLQDAQNKVNAANAVVQTSTQNLTTAQYNAAHAGAAHEKAVSELGTKLAGQASAQANTFSGHMKAVRTEVENGAASFGQKYGPALTKAGAALTGLGAVIKVVQGVQALFTTSTTVASAAQDTAAAATAGETAAVEGQTIATKLAAIAQAAFNLVMDANPIVLVVLAIAGLIAVIVLVTSHFVNWKAVIADVWSFIQQAFHDILGIVSGFFGWVAQNWPLLLAILTGPFGVAVYLIEQNWNAFVGFFTGIPGQIASIGAHMWDWMAAGFKAAVNAVISAWNSLHFTTPSVDIFGLHTPSVTIGVPQIPLLAQGGLITKEGLVYAHAGEAITPIPSGAMGAGVKIEHAHFYKELDVDATMKRLAWATRVAAL